MKGESSRLRVAMVKGLGKPLNRFLTPYSLLLTPYALRVYSSP